MRVFAALLCLLVVVVPPATAQEDAALLPANLQVLLLLRALAYDRSLGERSVDEVIIGVIYTPGDPASVSAKDGITETLQEWASKTLKQRRIRSIVIEYTTPEALERTVRDNNVAVLYITPGSSAHLEGVLKVSQAQRVTTVTGVPEYVKRGVALGVGRKANGSEIIINLRASRAEGSEFEARLLRSVTVL